MDLILFDWQRIFIGELSPLFLIEIVFRTVVMFLYTLFATRFIGKRGMGQITPFEFVVIIALGSAVGDPMFQPDVPLLYGMLVITIVVIFQKVLNATTNKFKTFEEIVESKSVLLVEHGVILEEALRDEGVSPSELCMQLRMKGVQNTGEVERAYLEPSGSLSVFIYEKGKERDGESTLPDKDS